jgi:hypothetical protein
LSVKLLVTLVGAVCLGVAFLTFTPIYAASGSNASPQVKQLAAKKISGGGCTNSDLKICLRADSKKNQVASEVFVKKSSSTPALVPSCPTSVTIKLFDNGGLIEAPVVGHGCGHFSGPTVSIKPKDEYVAQVVACFSADPADCAALPSPRVKSS